MPAVTVIVLNYNGARWLPGCLDALASQVGAPSFETLVVDNGSTDGSIALTRTSYPTVKLVEAGTNLGFTGGNNAGARVATGEWLAFLNNDTMVEPAWLARLWDAALAHPDFALITSRIVFLHDPSIVDSAGDGYLRAGAAFKHGHGAPAASCASSREVFGACGGAFMIRREAFEALGGFDERFFAVYEDVDLSYRARLRGLRVWYAADAVVRHAGSASLGPGSADAVFFGQRNLEWAWIKNTPRRAAADGRRGARDLFAGGCGPLRAARPRRRGAPRQVLGAARASRCARGSTPHPGVAHGRAVGARAPHGAALARRQAAREGVRRGATA